FRDLGKEVLLLMDSTTRMAMAQRQIGLSAGEPPTTKGYPPSVFGLLPKLLERSGRSDRGSITGLYTVLVEGDDLADPIADAIRGVLDGHVWLARDLANRGHYPAVSVLESISRVMVDVVDEEHRAAAVEVRRVLAVWNDIEDLVNVGAYATGANVEFDVAVKTKPAIDAFFQQPIGHEAVQRHDVVCDPQDRPVECVEAAGRERGFTDLAHLDELVGIEVHHPEIHLHAAEEADHQRGDRCHRRRSAHQHAAQAGREQSAEHGLQQKERLGNEPMDDRLLAERREWQADDVDAVDRLARRVFFRGVVVAPCRGEHAYRQTLLGQRLGGVLHVLSHRCGVGWVHLRDNHQGGLF
ncbi:MAG: hypothetical protein IH831_07975, partial [Planctomycetes bacterium]|nr:hypothetical protein [Planctomycetota bacterium]